MSNTNKPSDGHPKPPPGPGTPAGDNRANQMNPNNPAYHSSRGNPPPPPPAPKKK